jgi:hypothetical protein
MEEQLARQQRLMEEKGRIEAKTQATEQNVERIKMIKQDGEFKKVSVSQNDQERQKFLDAAQDQTAKTTEKTRTNYVEEAGGLETLQQNAVAEKKVLEEQRMAIRRDFEDGVSKLYNEGVDLYKKRRYPQALENFVQVNELIKGYKKTDHYVEMIEKELSKNFPSPRVKSVLPVQESVPAVPDSRNKAVSDVLDQFEGGAQK